MGAYKVILNPIAGRGRGGRIESELRQLLQAEGLEFDLVCTEHRGHAVELAAAAGRDGYQVVVAAGGDGTTHEVVNGLMATAPDDGPPTGKVGVIPVGSGSDFAHAMGVPPDLAGACQQLARGQERLIDVGRLTLADGTSRFFDNTVGLGFDALVTREALKVRWLTGIPLYLLVVLKVVFMEHRAPLVRVEYDDQELEFPALMVCVANGPREGGGFFVAPDAVPDDGLFDLCLAGDISRLAILGLIPHFMQGTHVDREPVTMARSRRVTISSDDNLVVHADGEMICTDGHWLGLEILPKRLRVWC